MISCDDRKGGRQVGRQPGLWVRRIRAGVLFAGCLALVGSAAAGSARLGAAKPTLTLSGPLYCGGLAGRGGHDDFRGLAYEPLIRFDGFDKPLRPALAASWKVKAGNKVITLTLRQNARFSDGAPADAEAVKTWLDWMVTQPSNALGVSYLGPLRSVDVISKLVVRITLKSPNPSFAYSLSNKGFQPGFITSPNAVGALKTDPKSTILSQQTFGAGPYMILPSETVIGDHCTYVPNPYYYDKAKIKWSKVVTRTLSISSSVLAAVQAGQVDVADGDASIVDQARASGLKVILTKGRYIGFTLLDHGAVNRALADVRVRQALNYALDRKAITAALYPIAGTPTSSPDPNGGGFDAKFYDYYKYDPAKARSLLAAAGYPNGFTLKAITVLGGLGFKLDALAQSMCKYFGDVEVKCDLKIATLAEYGGALGSRTYSAVTDVGPSDPVFNWYNAYLRPNAPRGDQHGWYDQALSKLVLKGQRAPDKAAVDIWRRALNQAITDAVMIPVSSPGVVTIVSGRVGGVVRPEANAMHIVDWYPTNK